MPDITDEIQPKAGLLKINSNNAIQYILFLLSWITPQKLLLVFLAFQPLMEYTILSELNLVRHLIWRILLLFLFFFTLYDQVFSGIRLKIPKNILLPLLLYISTAFFSTFLSLMRSDMNWVNALYALTTLTLLLLFIYVIPHWFNSPESVLKIINVYIFSTVLTNVYGVIDLLFNRFILNDIFFRMTSFFNDPNIYARYNLIGLFFLLSVLFFHKEIDISKKLYYWFALLLSGLSLFLSLSRSGYITLFLGLIIFSFLFKGMKYKLLLLSAAISLAVISVILLLTQRDFLGGTAFFEASTVNRLYLILGGINIIQDNWLFGVGYTNFGSYYLANYVTNVLRITEFNYYMMGYATSIHNWAIEILAEQGFWGLIGFILLFWNLLKYLFKKSKTLTAPLLKTCSSSFFLMMTVFLIHGFFYHTFIFHFFFWLMFGFTISHMQIINRFYQVTES